MCSVCEMKGQIYIQIRRVIVSKQLFCRRAIFKRLKIMHSGNTIRDANLPPNGGNPLFCTKILTPEIDSSKSEELISDSIGGSLKLLPVIHRQVCHKMYSSSFFITSVLGLS